jgi:methionyl-tRNA formyltransferase
MNNIRIVFMGTPEFAVATLGSMLMNGLNVVGVVTSPDKPAGRGRKITKSAVKEFAEFSSLPILQPESLKDSEFIANLKKLNPDIFIVVAFRMLPKAVWSIPLIGTVNLHASLLPNYRGAAPINHVIINGETITGVTTFLIDDKIDTGNILLRDEVQIFPFENAGDLHDRLMILGARLVVKTLSGISENILKPQPQSFFIKPGESLKLAPKIHPDDCIIDWRNESVKIHNFIRGLAPYPCARSSFKKGGSVFTFKIFESQPETANHKLKPGEIVSDGRSFIKIATRDGFISIVNLQLEGKTRMNTVDFLRGFRISDYSVTFSQTT